MNLNSYQKKATQHQKIEYHHDLLQANGGNWVWSGWKNFSDAQIALLCDPQSDLVCLFVHGGREGAFHAGEGILVGHHEFGEVEMEGPPVCL